LGKNTFSFVKNSLLSCKIIIISFHFKSIFELSCRESIKELHSATEDGSPGSISDYYIEMSRALLAIDKEDAACYFDSAIEIVSKYGN